MSDLGRNGVNSSFSAADRVWGRLGRESMLSKLLICQGSWISGQAGNDIQVIPEWLLASDCLSVHHFFARNTGEGP